MLCKLQSTIKKKTSVKPPNMLLEMQEPSTLSEGHELRTIAEISESHHIILTTR